MRRECGHVSPQHVLIAPASLSQEDAVHAAAKDVWSQLEEEKKWKVAGKEPPP